MTETSSKARRSPASSEEEAKSLLEEILSLLDAERKAVLVLDAAKLRELSEHKMNLSRILSRVVQNRKGYSKTVIDLLAEVRARAEANAILMHDAATSIAELLRVQSDANTYDARARLKMSQQSLGGRVA